MEQRTDKLGTSHTPENSGGNENRSLDPVRHTQPASDKQKASRAPEELESEQLAGSSKEGKRKGNSFRDSKMKRIEDHKKSSVNTNLKPSYIDVSLYDRTKSYESSDSEKEESKIITLQSLLNRYLPYLDPNTCNIEKTTTELYKTVTELVGLKKLETVPSQKFADDQPTNREQKDCG